MKRIWLTVAFCTLASTTQATTLQEVVQNVIQTNPQVRKEVALWRSYRFDAEGGKAAFRPRFDIDLGYGYEEVKNATANTLGSGLNRRELNLRLTQNLYNGGQDVANLERLKARRDAQALVVQATASKIALEAVKAYLEVLRAEELVRIARMNIKTHQRILQQIQLRFDSGLSDEVEVDQAKARLALAQSNLVAQESRLADARARYHRIMGHEVPNDLARPPLNSSAIPPDLEMAISIALLEHPLLRSAYADVAEAKAQYLASKGPFRPRIDAELTKGWSEDANGFNGSSENLQAMLRLRYNLYNGGADQARKDSTGALYQQASEIRNNTRREVIENLRYAWDAMIMAQNQMSYLDKHITLTRRTLLGYRKQFSLGRRSLLDLLNTESEYNTALIQMVNAEYDLITARYRVLEGMGRLLPQLKISSPLQKIQAEKDYQDE